MSTTPGVSGNGAKTAATVACPSCGTSYRWRVEFAGKELSCKCGAAFRPAAPAGTQAAAVVPAKPAAPPLKHDYKLAGGGQSAVARALENREDEAKPSYVRDFVTPMAVLPIGVVGAIGVWTWMTGRLSEGLVWYAAAVGAAALVFLPAGLFALVLVAKWFELGLGRLPTVALKAAGLTLGPAAIADAGLVAILVNTDFDWSSVVAGFGAYVVLCGPLTMWLFEMTVYEAALWVFLVFIPRVLAGYMAVPPLQHLLQ